MSGIGWQSRIANGRMAGTTGQKRAVEAIDLNLSGLVRASSVHYRMHVQKIGWQGWKSDGQMAGTIGRSLRGEALQIKLSGTAAAYMEGICFLVSCINICLPTYIKLIIVQIKKIITKIW